MNNFVDSRLWSTSLLCLLCMLSGLAHAATIFSENFQDGTIDGWATTGTVYANLYSGNYSIGMLGTASARRTISTAGYTGVNISLQMAAHSLEAGETCIADVSINGGTSWTAANTGLTSLNVLGGVIDPTDPNTLYVETEDHVFKSKHFKPGEHCWYFTRDGLKLFMGRWGYERVEFNTSEIIHGGREGIESFVFKKS